jgi:hypothetical protein
MRAPCNVRSGPTSPSGVQVISGMLAEEFDPVTWVWLPFTRPLPLYPPFTLNPPLTLFLPFTLYLLCALYPSPPNPPPPRTHTRVRALS